MKGLFITKHLKANLNTYMNFNDDFVQIKEIQTFLN